MSAKVAAVQAYIEKLSYNFTGVNYFDVRKHRPMGRILETGREITRQALPIKCVEAVFVGAYLTQGLKELERVPLSFRSQIDGVTYKHIVLALKHNSKWGSIGLSRRRELYYKDLVYDSLAELFLEYKRSYERVFHTLRRVKVSAPATASPRRSHRLTCTHTETRTCRSSERVALLPRPQVGLPLPHEVHAGEIICWGYISVKCLDASAASQQLADHGRSCHRLADQWRIECKKAKELGAKPPLPPQQQKKLEARKAKKEGAMGNTPDAKAAKEAPPMESDSSDDERHVAEVAEAVRDASRIAQPPCPVRLLRSGSHSPWRCSPDALCRRAQRRPRARCRRTRTVRSRRRRTRWQPFEPRT